MQIKHPDSIRVIANPTNLVPLRGSQKSRVLNCEALTIYEWRLYLRLYLLVFIEIMLTHKPFQFTSENQASIPIYRTKWKEIACSTRPLDREQVSLAINKAYEFLGISHPNIIFIADTEDALNYIYREVTASWGKLDRTSLGNAISTQLVNKLLGNIRNLESELIIKRLELNLDEGLAKSKAKIIANKIEPSLVNSLFFANTISIMDSTFEADPSLSGIPKIVIKSILDISSSGSFIQSQYFTSFQWQIFS